jgi:hypothetical protein
VLLRAPPPRDELDFRPPPRAAFFALPEDFLADDDFFAPTRDPPARLPPPRDEPPRELFFGELFFAELFFAELFFAELFFAELFFAVFLLPDDFFAADLPADVFRADDFFAADFGALFRPLPAPPLDPRAPVLPPPPEAGVASSSISESSAKTRTSSVTMSGSGVRGDVAAISCFSRLSAVDPFGRPRRPRGAPAPKWSSAYSSS